MPERRLRVALFGRFSPESSDREPAGQIKAQLRDEARKRDYVVVEEFWEDDVSLDAPLEDRPVMKRLIASIWNDELNIDGVFMPELTELGWTSRKEQVVFTMLFEQNNIAIITFHEFYHPDDWLAAYSF
jgi:hypothetical protein